MSFNSSTHDAKKLKKKILGELLATKPAFRVGIQTYCLSQAVTVMAALANSATLPEDL